MTTETVNSFEFAYMSRHATPVKITGQTFTAQIGELERKFIIHKPHKQTKRYILTDCITGGLVAEISTTKKDATEENARKELDKQINLRGAECFIAALRNAELKVGITH